MDEQAKYEVSETLYSGVGYIKTNLVEVLAQPPKMEWLKEHPEISGHWYLPIDKVEFLLERLFESSNISIQQVTVTDKNVTVVVRIDYTDKNGNNRHTDGIASAEINERQNISMASPLAESLAVKDAAEHLGNIFGRNLNRYDTIKIVKGKPNTETESVLNKLSADLKKADSVSTIEVIYKNYISAHPKLIKHIKAYCAKATSEISF